MFMLMALKCLLIKKKKIKPGDVTVQGTESQSRQGREGFEEKAKV